jgi:hypothetical protein
MENKICGGCKYHNPISGICIKLGKKPSKTLPSCPYRPTNGDRIRSMSNEEFSNFLCKNLRAVIRKPEVVGDNYEQILLAWLNTPADF